MIDSDTIFAVQLGLTIVLILTFLVMAVNISRIRHMLQSSLFPYGFPDVIRACLHCKERIQIEASVCPHCQRELDPWVMREGHWWKRDDTGQEVYLDPRTREWMKPSTSP